MSDEFFKACGRGDRDINLCECKAMAQKSNPSLLIAVTLIKLHHQASTQVADFSESPTP